MHITYSDGIIKCNTCFTNLRSGQQQRGFYGIKIKGNMKNKCDVVHKIVQIYR